MIPVHEELLREFEQTGITVSAAKLLMEHVSKRLHEKMTRYNWVGFYLIDPADAGALKVGPFSGSFTPHGRIPLDSGLCGAAATSGQTIVVHDVTRDPRYLSGSAMVKCEVVVPIFAKNRLAGELDILSYFAGTFSKSEQEFIEACAALVGKYIAKS